MSVEELGLAHASVSASVTQSTTSVASGVVALSEHNTKKTSITKSSMIKPAGYNELKSVE
jgi:hypothetical protein